MKRLSDMVKAGAVKPPPPGPSGLVEHRDMLSFVEVLNQHAVTVDDKSVWVTAELEAYSFRPTMAKLSMIATFQMGESLHRLTSVWDTAVKLPYPHADFRRELSSFLRPLDRVCQSLGLRLRPGLLQAPT